MYRQVIIPEKTSLTLHLPADFVGRPVEVIAFRTDDIPEQPLASEKRTYHDAIEFFKKNSIDFNKIEKWKREDLYE